jgi:NADH:ubiquinone oxidoreductase subunit K
MIPGIGLNEVLIVSTLLFFIGVYGFITRTNLISMLISVELCLNAAVLNFVFINKYLYPDKPEGVIYALFIIAVAAAETALVVAIIVNLYKKINSVEVHDMDTLKY